MASKRKAKRASPSTPHGLTYTRGQAMGDELAQPFIRTRRGTIVGQLKPTALELHGEPVYELTILDSVWSGPRLQLSEEHWTISKLQRTQVEFFEQQPKLTA